MKHIRYVHNKAENSQIIVIDDFWDKGNKVTMKKKAANASDISFISLNNIKRNVNYQTGKGTVVYDEVGHVYVIEHDGMAKQPGDKGMAHIAKVVEKAIRLIAKVIECSR